MVTSSFHVRPIYKYVPSLYRSTIKLLFAIIWFCGKVWRTNLLFVIHRLWYTLQMCNQLQTRKVQYIWFDIFLRHLHWNLNFTFKKWCSLFISNDWLQVVTSHSCTSNLRVSSFYHTTNKILFAIIWCCGKSMLENSTLRIIQGLRYTLQNCNQQQQSCN